jgi:Mce-associated membrane protein
MAADKPSDAPPVSKNGHSTMSPTDPDKPLSPDDALALAEAEAAEADAMAAAARARARAIRLRTQAAEAGGSDATEATSTVAVVDESQAVETSHSQATETTAATEAAPAKPPSRWLHRRWLRRVLVALIALLVCALVAATGFMVWQHHKASAQRQRSAEFGAAARQGVITLMSIDFNKAKDDVQRIVDNSTGQFKTDFQAQADDMVKASQDAKVVTTATVASAAVQSMTDNSAVVLVAANSEVTNAAGAKKEPRTWRLSVTVARDGGQMKLSRVEFVP